MKRLVLTMVCVMLTMGMIAKDDKGNNKKAQTEKKQFSPEMYYKHMENYISKETNLTDSEKEKFFPVFREMLEEQRKIVEQDRDIMKSFKDAKTESEFESIIEKTTDLQIENKKIEKNYYKKFAKILTWEKICKVRMAQTKFNMHALRRFSPNTKKMKGWNKGNKRFRKGVKNENKD